MIQSIFETLSNGASSFITFFKSLLENLIQIFYTTGADGASGALTDIGILAVVAVSISFVMFGFRMVSRLIKLRG